jgi:hypothetical protein
MLTVMAWDANSDGDYDDVGDYVNPTYAHPTENYPVTAILAQFGIYKISCG